MTAKFFTNTLRRRLAGALGQNESITHDALDNLWIEFNDNTALSDVTKPKKANEMVEKIAKKPQADSDFLEIINETFFIDSRSEWRQREQTFRLLKGSLVAAEFGYTEEGFTLPPASEQEKHSTTTPSAIPTAQQTTEPWASNWTGAKKDRTSMPDQIGEGRSVFIVHGRDIPNRDALVKLLKQMDVKAITWNEAASKSSSQETLKIVEAGMSLAQAIIVLFTPDDLAKLQDKFLKDPDGTHERKPTGQARPNVILEAGMAYAKAPDRTIFARVGHLREISDISGFNWVDLDNGYDSRDRLRRELVKAKVKLDAHKNIIDPEAGEFRL